MDVDTKKLFCCRVASLKLDSYYACSHDTEVVLRGKGLCKFVSEGKATQPEASGSDVASSLCSGELEGEV